MKSETYCIDIYTQNIDCMGEYRAVSKMHPKHGNYIQLKVHADDKEKVIKKIRHRKIRYRCYEERWERSSNYRETFMKAYRPPYRCRYCNKLIGRECMKVDHIVPVAKTKTSTNARMLLYIQGISNVNDIRNLAPSCKRCNDRKGSKLGFWWIKGIFGKHQGYWILRKAFFAVCILSAVYLCYAVLMQ